MPYIGNAPYQGTATSFNILDGTIDTPDIKDGAITGSKLGAIEKILINTGVDDGINKIQVNGGIAVTGGSIKEAKVAMAANDIDLSLANYFTKTITGTTTITVSNIPNSGTAISFILDITNGGSATITWWTNMKWANGTAPVLTAAGRDILAFLTYDGGTTWAGLILGKDVK